MSRTLAIDWDENELRIVLANIQNGSVSIEGSASTKLADGESKDKTILASRIKESLAANRLKASDAIVAIGRSEVELRSMTVPPVPANELSDIVRFQALKEFSEISEAWPIDYLPLVSNEKETTVKAAVISPQRAADVRAILEDADLKATGLVLRPTAAAVLVENTVTNDVVLVVDTLQQGAEFSVTQGRDIHFMRNVRLPEGEPAWTSALVNELRRTVGAAQNQCRLKIDRIVLFGGNERSSLTSRISSDMNLKVDLLNPFDQTSVAKGFNPNTVQQPGRFAGAVGMLVDQAREDEHRTIDFFNPRRPPAPPSRNMLYTILGCAAAAVLLAGMALLYWRVSGLNNQIADLGKQKQSMKAAVASAKTRAEELASVEEWIDNDIVWLDELHRLSTVLPDAEKVRLNRIQGTITQKGGGILDLTGISDGNDSLKLMENSLAGEKRRVRGDEVTIEKDPRYPLRFKEIVTLETNANDPSRKPTQNTNRRQIAPRRSP